MKPQCPQWELSDDALHIRVLQGWSFLPTPAPHPHEFEKSCSLLRGTRTFLTCPADHPNSRPLFPAFFGLTPVITIRWMANSLSSSRVTESLLEPRNKQAKALPCVRVARLAFLTLFPEAVGVKKKTVWLFGFFFSIFGFFWRQLARDTIRLVLWLFKCLAENCY